MAFLEKPPGLLHAAWSHRVSRAAGAGLGRLLGPAPPAGPGGLPFLPGPGRASRRPPLLTHTRPPPRLPAEAWGGEEGVPPPRPPTPALPGRRVCSAGRPQQPGPAPPRLASPPGSFPSLPSLPSAAALSLAPISVRLATFSPRGVSEGRWLIRAAWLLPLVTAFTFCLNSSSI